MRREVAKAIRSFFFLPLALLRNIAKLCRDTIKFIIEKANFFTAIATCVMAGLTIFIVWSNFGFLSNFDKDFQYRTQPHVDLMPPNSPFPFPIPAGDMFILRWPFLLTNGSDVAVKNVQVMNNTGRIGKYNLLKGKLYHITDVNKFINKIEDKFDVSTFKEGKLFLSPKFSPLPYLMDFSLSKKQYDMVYGNMQIDIELPSLYIRYDLSYESLFDKKFIKCYLWRFTPIAQGRIILQGDNQKLEMMDRRKFSEFMKRHRPVEGGKEKPFMEWNMTLLYNHPEEVGGEKAEKAPLPTGR